MNRNELFLLSAFGLSAAACAKHGATSESIPVMPPRIASPQNTTQTPVPDVAEAQTVIAFWQEAGPGKWFAKDPEFDALFRERFASLHTAAAEGKLEAWERTPNGALGLVILLDQYPRNSFRGTPRMYGTDALARRIAGDAIAAGLDRWMPSELQVFAYLPFSHSENLADQQRAVELCRKIGEPHLAHAIGHRDIIERFGRFPHRNPILGRGMTADEQRYLDEGGFKG